MSTLQAQVSIQGLLHTAHLTQDIQRASHSYCSRYYLPDATILNPQTTPVPKLLCTSALFHPTRYSIPVFWSTCPLSKFSYFLNFTEPSTAAVLSGVFMQLTAEPHLRHAVQYVQNIPPPATALCSPLTTGGYNWFLLNATRNPANLLHLLA